MLVNIARNMLHSTNSKTQGPGKHEHSYIYIYIHIYTYIYIIYICIIYKWHACPGSYNEDPGEEEEGGGRMDDRREGRGWKREQ